MKRRDSFRITVMSCIVISIFLVFNTNNLLLVKHNSNSYSWLKSHWWWSICCTLCTAVTLYWECWTITLLTTSFSSSTPSCVSPALSTSSSTAAWARSSGRRSKGWSADCSVWWSPACSKFPPWLPRLRGRHSFNSSLSYLDLTGELIFPPGNHFPHYWYNTN